MKSRPIIMDVDTGVDDAIAIFLAAGSPELEILGITTVAGNQTLEKTTRNTLKVAELLGLDIPIAKGARYAILQENEIAPDIHGESGLGFYVDAQSDYPLSDLSAVDLMAKLISQSDEKVTLVPTGPLTNIAVFLKTYPDLKEKIELISLMGGGALDWNHALVTEFNFFNDPEAAQIVFNSGIPIVMSGLDVTHKAYITREEIDRLVAKDNELSSATKGMLDFYFARYMKKKGFVGAALHDSVAVAYLIDPDLFHGYQAYVEMELEGAYTRGASMVDGLNLLGKKANVFVLDDLKREEFIKITIDRFQDLLEKN